MIGNRFRALLGDSAGDAGWQAELVARYWDEQRSEQENMELIGYWLRQRRAASALPGMRRDPGGEALDRIG